MPGLFLSHSTGSADVGAVFAAMRSDKMSVWLAYRPRADYELCRDLVEVDAVWGLALVGGQEQTAMRRELDMAITMGLPVWLVVEEGADPDGIFKGIPQTVFARDDDIADIAEVFSRVRTAVPPLPVNSTDWGGVALGHAGNLFVGLLMFHLTPEEKKSRAQLKIVSY